MYPGVVVVTDKRIYILSITGQETEEPGDWLDLITCADTVRLVKVGGMLGGQGVGLEIGASNNKPAQQTFYRLVN